MRKLELLAPAKNLECGIAAIDCGADAVYIGAARFGARAAAGNSVDDIGRLCQYAHRFDAKVYVTLNTIIYDSEMDDTLALAEQLREAGVDALLLQDMGLVGRVALPIHASTQCDTRTAEKALWLESLEWCWRASCRSTRLPRYTRLRPNWSSRSLSMGPCA